MNLLGTVGGSLSLNKENCTVAKRRGGVFPAAGEGRIFWKMRKGSSGKLRRESYGS
jgi:hypothetical protein